MSNQHKSQYLKTITSISDACSSKNAKKGLKALTKAADLSYLLGGASMVAQLIEGLEVKSSNTPLHIVIDSALDQDIFDHCRWYALVPLLLSQPRRKFQFTILVRGDFTDTPTQFRKVIDYIIAVELENNVDVRLIDSTLADFMETEVKHSIDLVINNVVSIHSVSDEREAVAIHQLVSQQVPYFVCDVATIPLMLKTSYLSIAGVTSSSHIIKNPTPIYFSKFKTVRYAHFGYAIKLEVADENFTYDATCLDRLTCLEYQLLDRFEHQDALMLLPHQNGTTVNLFKGVSFDTETEIFTISYMGDQYQISADGIELNSPYSLASQDITEQSANVCWALSIYGEIVNKIKMRNAA